MKINCLDAHDRLLHVQKQSVDIQKYVDDIIAQKPFGNHPFYIFAHARTMEDGATKRLIWQPRLTKPLPQTNSMLFRAYPRTDHVKILWMIPAREMWPQYKKGNVTASEIVQESIQDFQFNRKKLEATEPDELSESQIDAIYREIAQEAKSKAALH
jgi:hypothetical protein